MMQDDVDIWVALWKFYT